MPWAVSGWITRNERSAAQNDLSPSGAVASLRDGLWVPENTVACADQA